MTTATKERGPYDQDIVRANLRIPASPHTQTETSYSFRVIGNLPTSGRVLFALDVGDVSFSVHLPRAALEALRDVLVVALPIEEAPSADVPTGWQAVET